MSETKTDSNKILGIDKCRELIDIELNADSDDHNKILKLCNDGMSIEIFFAMNDKLKMYHY